MAQHRLGQRHDIVDRRRKPAIEQRAGAHRQHEGLAGARARSPGDLSRDSPARPSPGRAARTSCEDGLHHLFAHRHAPHESLRLHQISARADRLDALASSPKVVASSMRRSASRSG